MKEVCGPVPLGSGRVAMLYETDRLVGTAHMSIWVRLTTQLTVRFFAPEGSVNWRCPDVVPRAQRPVRGPSSPGP